MNSVGFMANGFWLISAATRLQGIFFWDFFIYLIEGLVFLITGLQARTLLAGIGPYSISELAISAAVVSAVVIVARFVWMYPATYLPRWLFPSIRRRDPSPPWQTPFMLAFTGVRGIVSLAAGLAIPSSWRHCFLCVSRLVFRRKVEDSASLPKSSTFQ
jgi:monovalent cation/hydrogen antiporter